MRVSWNCAADCFWNLQQGFIDVNYKAHQHRTAECTIDTQYIVVLKYMKNTLTFEIINNDHGKSCEYVVHLTVEDTFLIVTNIAQNSRLCDCTVFIVIIRAAQMILYSTYHPVNDT